MLNSLISIKFHIYRVLFLRSLHIKLFYELLDCLQMKGSQICQLVCADSKYGTKKVSSHQIFYMNPKITLKMLKIT